TMSRSGLRALGGGGGPSDSTTIENVKRIKDEDPDGFLAETYAPEGAEDKAAYFELQNMYRVGPSFPARKLIVNFATGEALAFDLIADPGESHPLDVSGVTWERMRKKVLAPEVLEGITVDPEVERRLKSLGYIHD